MKKFLFVLSALAMITLASCGGGSKENSDSDSGSSENNKNYSVNIEDYTGDYLITEVTGEFPEEFKNLSVTIIPDGEDINLMILGQMLPLKKQSNGSYKHIENDETTTLVFEEKNGVKMLSVKAVEDGHNGGFKATQTYSPKSEKSDELSSVDEESNDDYELIYPAGEEDWVDEVIELEPVEEDYEW